MVLIFLINIEYLYFIIYKLHVCALKTPTSSKTKMSKQIQGKIGLCLVDK